MAAAMPQAAVPGDESDRELLAAYLVDSASRQLLDQFAEQRGWPGDEIQEGGLAAAGRMLGLVPPARVVVLDISGAENSEEAHEVIRGLKAEGAAVVALGGLNDVGLYRSLVGAGAVDYLVKPVTLEMLDASVELALHKPAGGEVAVRRGQTLAVSGVRGGVGASLLTASLAWVAAETLMRRVLLIDLDLAFGIQALLLDAETGRGLREALEDPERVDALFVERAVSQPANRLHLLAADPGTEVESAGLASALAALIDEVATHYDLVLVDLPRHLLLGEVTANRVFDGHLLVGDPGLASLRDANRLTRLLRSGGEQAPSLHYVINGVGKGRGAEVLNANYRQALEPALLAELPFDPETTRRSADMGRPLSQLAPRGRLTKGVEQLAVSLFGAPPRRRRKNGLFSGLRRRK
ncbi:AAA family ATPase [Aquibaculum sediminis]|uniref:AAA family ATPase n=1 Tax=Aquibaculum sediminis TaxID=3231907 RepID=UPI0034541A95